MMQIGFHPLEYERNFCFLASFILWFT